MSETSKTPSSVKHRHRRRKEARFGCSFRLGQGTGTAMMRTIGASVAAVLMLSGVAARLRCCVIAFMGVGLSWVWDVRGRRMAGGACGAGGC